MNLSDRVSLGNIELKNRIVMAPMISNLANPDGSTNENHISYLEQRAKGGASLIITEYSYVNDRNARGSRNEMGIYNPDHIPKFRRLTERIHLHNSAIFVQLVHAGGKAFLETNRQPAYAPSSVDYAGTTPAEMSTDDIEQVIHDFERAAKIAEHSNFDGVEIHGAHGYLVQEFMSPSLNRRADRYGNDFNGRIRFAQEIIDSIRGATSLNVGIRLSLYEDDPDGYGPDYGLKIAESLKGIDYAHFSAGRFAPPGSSSSYYSGKTHIYRKLPRKPSVTTIVVGSVTNRNDAVEILGKADLVAVGRAMLADPEFASKIIRNSNTIRPCIRCNQACRDLGYGEVRCTVNPDLGLEATSVWDLRMDGLSLSIGGAGVKGLEAAVFAASRGASVTIYEKNSEIGGQLLEITDPEKRMEFDSLIRYYGRMIERYGISLKLGQELKGEGVECNPDREYPDIPDKPEIRIDSNIYKYHDQALKLADEGREVIMTERSLSSLDRVRRDGFLAKAAALGIKFTKEPMKNPDVSVIQRFQYDIRSAMISGREAVRSYLSAHSDKDHGMR
jgi:hypothetical protein